MSITTSISIDPHLLTRVFERSNAAKWRLSREELAHALGRSLAGHFEGPPPGAAVPGYLESLHLEELALAAACAEGKMGAWAYFIECFRPGLCAAARLIAGEQGGTTLADTLLRQLYLPADSDGERRSLLADYRGRSRLGTWLRAVMLESPARHGCPHVESLAARSDRSLPEAEEREVDAHAASCPRCHAILGQLARTAPAPPAMAAPPPGHRWPGAMGTGFFSRKKGSGGVSR